MADKKKILKATHTGKLTIGDMILKCDVLSDGTRLITQSAFMKTMGMYYSGGLSTNRSQEDLSANIPQFLTTKLLKPFISKHLDTLQSITLDYQTFGGSMARGIKAEIIPKICEIWLDADEKLDLVGRQKKIANNAKILIRALAHIGIIALVDEATGYQAERKKGELQKLLSKWIEQETYRQWTKTFPLDFYEQMFRLKGWNLLNPKLERPGVVGKYTNDFIYERLAPKLLLELEKKNPIGDKGHRKSKHHQWLTAEVGHPALAQHIHAIIGLMKAAANWDDFKRLVNRAFPKYGDNLELPFD